MESFQIDQGTVRFVEMWLDAGARERRARDLVPIARAAGLDLNGNPAWALGRWLAAHSNDPIKAGRSVYVIIVGKISYGYQFWELRECAR